MTINYLCPDGSIISGGIKVIYDHVALLNKNGIKARVVHEEGIRANWFDNKVPVTSRIDVKKNDVLVVPEGYGLRIVDEFSKLNCRKVVLAQSWSYIVPSFGYQPSSEMRIRNWREGGFDKVLAVSHFVKQAVTEFFGYSDKNVVYCPHYVDEVFSSVVNEPEMNDKMKNIVFYPRKDPARYQETILTLLQMMPGLKNWKITPVDAAKQSDVAELMKRSAIFLTTSNAEGFGLPILEAFATNAVAVGHTGIGSEEFFTHGFSDASNTVYNTARKLKEAIEMFDNQDFGFWNKTMINQKDNLQHYSKENTEKKLVEFYRDIGVK